MYHVYARVHTHLRSSSRDRGERFVRFDVGADAVRIVSNVFQPRLNDLAHANRTQQHVCPICSTGRNMHVCDHVYRPSVRLDAVRHRSSSSVSSLSETLEQIALAATHTRTYIIHASRISYRLRRTWIMSIAIDEIISIPSNRVIVFEERGMYFA